MTSFEHSELIRRKVRRAQAQVRGKGIIVPFLRKIIYITGEFRSDTAIVAERYIFHSSTVGFLLFSYTFVHSLSSYKTRIWKYRVCFILYLQKCSWYLRFFYSNSVTFNKNVILNICRIVWNYSKWNFLCRKWKKKLFLFLSFF